MISHIKDSRDQELSVIPLGPGGETAEAQQFGEDKERGESLRIARELTGRLKTREKLQRWNTVQRKV